jgi:hypothetical protein
LFTYFIPAIILPKAVSIHTIHKSRKGLLNVLLSLIDQMKNVLPLPRCYSQIEADAHGVHGQIALNEGTEESARRAVVHFEDKLLQVNEQLVMQRVLP